MGKFDRVLFASDFDHTLSNLHDEIPAENLEAIRYFTAEGGVFTIASGRSIPTLRPRVAQVPVNAPCIVYNGACCFDYSSGEMCHVHPLPSSCRALLAALRTRFPEERVELQTAEAHYAFGEDANRDAYLRACGTPVRYADVEEVPQPWLKMAVYGRFRRPAFDAAGDAAPEVLEHFRQIECFAARLGAEECTAIRSGPRIVEIFSAQCSKGSAARTLAERMGRPLLACAGDAPNDIAMLQAADFAFCPADAEPQLLALPGVQTVAPCGAAAVADAIARLETLL